jgi:GT2 family glycosyltransferase
MRVTVVVVTLDRPECVLRCLQCLAGQSVLPDQVIVVDASKGHETRRIVEGFPQVLYLQNYNGYGRMTASRNIGLKAADGNIICFIDDDAFARKSWLRSLLETYERHPDVGAVGGRALNNQPGETEFGAERIGRLTPNGFLEGWFAADPGRVIEVDHLIGCNMSFRREVLGRLGGFRTDYPGISGVREDSDMCLRVKSLRYRILFNPSACVEHIGAPQASGRRFDWRYAYYAQRNHTAMLLRNFGPASAILWRSIFRSAAQHASEFVRRMAAASLRLGASVAGTVIGIGSGARLWAISGCDPLRRDGEGEAIRTALTSESMTAKPDGVPAR